MKKTINLFVNIFRENNITFLWVLLFFLIGVVLGSYTIFYMSDFNKGEIGNYFNGFMLTIDGRSLSYTKILIESIGNIIPTTIIIIFLGYTVIGAPIILVLNLIKGYIIGYTFSLLVTILGTKGVLIVILGVLLQNLIFIPCFIFISIVAIKNSLLKIKLGINKERLKLEELSKNYINIQSVFSIILLIGILIETYISPNLITLVIT